jgi:hypothetical protein
MKKIVFLLGFALFASVLSAQTKKNTTPATKQATTPVQKTNNTATLYQVFLGTFAEAKIEDFKAFAKLGLIYAEELGEGQSKIFVGDFDNQASAERILKQVKAQGYNDAKINLLKLNESKNVPYIQLAAKKVGESIDWAAFEKAGKVYVVANEKEVKIVSSGFENDSIANLSLATLQKNGFKSAFLKKTLLVAMHKVGAFETAQTTLLNEALVLEKPTPTTPPIITTEPPQVSVEANNYKGRFSNTQLKAALSALGYYKGKIDDTKDSRLESSFKQAMEKDRVLSKYVILAQAMKPANEKFSDLQKAINAIPNNPVLAEQTLKKSSLPIAKAYRAYILFTREGVDVKEVNKLMNEAVKEAFKAVKDNPFNFDPAATYAYIEIGQVIQHIRYIQGVAKDEPFAPTWLFTEHPKETKAAYLQGKGFKMIASDEFLNTFDALKMSVSMAQDLNPTFQPDAKIEAQAAQQRTQLYHLPSPNDLKNKEELLGWNQLLWKGIDAWAQKDDANKPLYNAFKASYYRSLQQFEKYYLDKKYSQDEATILGLNILRQSFGKSLEKFVYLSAN